MKKSANFLRVITIVGILLSLLSLFLLVSCGGNGTDPSTSSSPTSSPVTSGTPPTPVDPEDFEDVNDTVYVITGEVNIRKTPKVEEGNVFRSAVYGEAFPRVAKNEKWSRILIDGREYYLSNDCVATEILEFSDVSPVKLFMVKEGTVNVRTYPIVAEDNLCGVLAYGDPVTKIAIATKADGDGVLWAKITAEVTTDVSKGTKENVTGYLNDAFLAEKMPEEPTYDVTFDDMNDILVVKTDPEGDVQTINLRTYPKLEEKSLSGLAAKSGDELPRTGLATKEDADGILWSRVVLNGKTYYISSNPKYVEPKK